MNYSDNATSQSDQVIESSTPQPSSSDCQGGQSGSPYVPLDQPAFIVGVTGHMDPTDPERLTEQVKQLFRFLRHGASKFTKRGSPGKNAEDSNTEEIAKAAVELQQQLVPLIANSARLASSSGFDPSDVYTRFFSQWPGLGNTPIIVLSSLAPGADQIVAKVALDPEFATDNFRLLCPLPVSLDHYRKASTFVRKPAQGAPEEEQRIIAAENQKRIEELERIVPDDDDPRCFAVAVKNRFSPGDPNASLADVAIEDQIKLLRDDLELTDDQRSRLYELDLRDENKKRRHRRYQAAGEYIAAYSHLMIAIWDHIEDKQHTVGTAAIVHARRTGLTPGLLPTTSDLPLPPDGGVLQIYTKRIRRRDAEERSGDPGDEPTWSLRWLFANPGRGGRDLAATSDGDVIGAINDLDAESQHVGLNQLACTAKLLRDFSDRKHVESQRAAKHLRTFLTYHSTCVLDRVREKAGPLYSMIQEVADFRRRAADEQQYNEATHANRTRSRLFLYTMIAALLLHAFNHWHSQIPHASHDVTPTDVAAAHQSSPAKQETRSDQQIGGHSFATTDPASSHKTNDTQDISHRHPKWLSVLDRALTFAIGLMGMGFAAYALYYFLFQRSFRHDEKANDLRAIAEGSRVQLIWHMAGLGQSVSSNYMSRQRGELSWIRRTIQSVAMPYEQARWQFDRIDRDLQISMLRCVSHNWLRGHDTNAQANYFSDAYDKM